MKYIDHNSKEYWQMTNLNQWTHDMIHGKVGKPQHKINDTAVEIVMNVIGNKFKELKEEHKSNFEKFTVPNKKILKAIAKIHNDLGYKNNFDFEHIEIEEDQEGN